MTKLIKTWEELAAVPANDKFKIFVNKKLYGGWIIPVCDEMNDDEEHICNCSDEIKNEHYFKNHVYLSTHTFYGSNYKRSTEILQKYGFDIEIDNWDKDRK